MSATIRVTIIFGNSHTPPFGSIVHICDSLDEAHRAVWRTVHGAGARGAVVVAMAVAVAGGTMGWYRPFESVRDIPPPVLRTYWRVHGPDGRHEVFASRDSAKAFSELWVKERLVTRVTVRAKRGSR